MKSLREMIDRRMELRKQSTAILDKADAEKRQPNAEELQQYDRIDAEIDQLNDDIERRQQAGNGRQVPPNPPGAGRPAPSNPAEPLRLVVGYDRLARQDRVITLQAGSREHQRAQEAYRRAFLSYLGTGREALGLQVAKDPKGGYLAPTTFVAKLIKFLDDNVFMRQLATVLPPMGDAVSLGVPTWDTDPNDADWTPEVPASDISEDDAATIGKREFMPHLMSKLVKMSMKLMRSSLIDPENLLVERVGYKVAVTEEKAYLTGDGAQQPLGVFVASNDGIPTSRDTTTVSTTAHTADELINTFYSLKEPYQRNATWLGSREFFKRTRKLKDGNGQYLWAPGLSGQPSTVLDRPYVQSEFAPSTFTTGLYVAIVGDFKAGYWIGDSLSLEIQRLMELFALKNQVGFVARKETDGAPVLAEAFARLKLA